MANAFGTLSTGLVVQEALDLVFKMYPVLNRITKDFSNEQLNFNQAVNTRKIALPTVSNFGSAATDRADTNISVTLDQHKEIKHNITVAEYSGTDRNLIQESAQPIAEAIGTHMVAAISALWTNANYGGGSTQETVTAAASFNYSALTTHRATLNGRGVPKSNRFVVCGTTPYATLLNDSLVVATQNNPVGGMSIQEGMLSKVAGFDIFEYPDLLTTGTSTGTKVAVCGSPDSTIMVSRVQKDPRATLSNASFPGAYGVVSNAQSGLSVLVREWIDPTNMSANIAVSWMYGVAVGNTNNLQIIKSA